MSTYTLLNSTKEEVRNLAFLHLQYNYNEKAFENGVITRAMYEYARDILQKSIDTKSRECYNPMEGKNIV